MIKACSELPEVRNNLLPHSTGSDRLEKQKQQGPRSTSTSRRFQMPTTRVTRDREAWADRDGGVRVSSLRHLSSCSESNKKIGITMRARLTNADFKGNTFSMCAKFCATIIDGTTSNSKSQNIDKANQCPWAKNEESSAAQNTQTSFLELRREFDVKRR